jgi:hypothetical protein
MLLDDEMFHSSAEARLVIESWRRHYNTPRPRGSLDYDPRARDLRASSGRAVGFATFRRQFPLPPPSETVSQLRPSSFAARASPEAVDALTFNLDRSVGADHSLPSKER